MAEIKSSLAIAIGINQYQNGIACLNTAKPDAEELAKLLTDKYQYQVELITDNTKRKPTLKELENLLTKWLPEQLQQSAKKNRLLFYFAGHGMALESDDGPRGFLLPQDANPNPKPGEPNNFLSMQYLHDALIALPCHHLIVILDCCFAGTFRWASTRKLGSVPETIRREHYDRFIRYPAWQVITSAAHNQEALDFLSDKRGISKKSQASEKKHSPFAEALFEALQDGEPDEKGRRYKKADLTKDGVITAPELYLYLRDSVETRSSERQTPGLYPLKKHDRGEYIFHDPNFNPQTLSKADPIDETNNPYRGLKPFEEQHAHFFFGRQEVIETLYARIAAPDHSLTVVLGVSGSGKSSLVKAGLLPYLRGLSKPPINDLDQWHILNPMRPGELPFAALARTVWALANMPTTVELDSLGFLSERLNQKTEQLNTQVAEAANKHGETSRTTQRLKQEAEKFAQITTIWNQDTHAAKQLLIVEHFETLYALCQSQGEPESQQQQQLKQVFLACLNPLTEQLQPAPNSLVEIVKAWSQKHPGVNLLLVIDQFEELITLSRKVQPNPQSDTPEEWQQFLQLLETTLAANLPQLRIVVTLRSDFEPRFLNSEALKSYWTRARFPVRAMRSDELRQAIEGPASEMALYFEPANLVDRLIDEVGQMPGALPLLSFTLSEFYIKLAEKWRDGESSDRALTISDRALTIDASFDKEGGVAGSLTRRANEEYSKIGEDKTLGEAAQRTMRRVMLRMLTSEGGETARRRVPESELVYPTQEESDRVKQVVDRLVEARLLVKGQLETGEPYVEAAHDFLVRGWGTLQDWINEEKAKETLEVQQRLTAQANDWARNNRPDGLLLPDGDRLNQLEKLSELSDKWFNLRESELIRCSLAYREIQQKQSRELRARDELQRGASRVRDLLSVQPLAALVLAIQLTGRNREELPDEILTPIQNSLYLAMEQAKESMYFRAPQNKLFAIALSPDGQKIVTGDEDGIIQVWDLQGNPTRQPFRGHQGGVYSVAFSPDNERIVSGGEDGIVYVWDLQGNSVALQGHESRVSCVAFSPKEEIILSGSWDNTLRLWDFKGNLLTEPFRENQAQKDNDAVCAAAFSPDGQMVVSGHSDKMLRLWDLQGSLIAQPFQGHEADDFKDAVSSVAFNPDGQQIVSGGVDRTIRLWDLQGNPKGQPFRGHQDSVSSVTFSHDGKTIISGSASADGTVRIWDLEGNPIGQPLRGHEGVRSVVLSPDGKHMVSGGLDGTVRIWDLTAISIGKPFEGHTDGVCAVAFSRNGQKIVSGSWHWDGTLRLWDLQGQLIGEPFHGHEHEHRVSSVAFSPDSEMIVSGSSDKTIRLWNLQGMPIGEPFRGHEQEVNSVAVSPDGETIASGSKDATVRLWNLQGESISEPFRGHEQGVNSIAFSPDGTILVSGSDDGTIRLWNLKGEPVCEPFRESKRVYSVAFNSDGNMIVSGGETSTVQLWDLQGKRIKEPFSGHQQGVYAVAFSPSGNMIASQGQDGTMRIWDLEGNLIVQPLQAHGQGACSLAFSPDGQMIVSTGHNKTLRLWRSHWHSWLKVCCDRLRYHPVFKNPQTDSAKAACEICQKYVWSKEDTSV
jgi:WD40 repeat protein